MITILGIDPSLNSTGWSIVTRSGQSFELLAHDTITPPKSMRDVVEKVILISKEINEIIKKHPNISSIAMEDTFSNVNPSSSLKLGMVRGAIIAMAGQNNTPIYQYLPRIVKQVVVGKGNAEKEQVAFMVKHALGIKNASFRTMDITDSIAIAMAHAMIQDSPILRQIANR
jgi:crossover junction endodeoxyribonuclease RuvC